MRLKDVRLKLPKSEPAPAPADPLTRIFSGFPPPFVRKIKVPAGIGHNAAIGEARRADPRPFTSASYDSERGIVTLFTVPKPPADHPTTDQGDAA